MVTSARGLLLSARWEGGEAVTGVSACKEKWYRQRREEKVVLKDMNCTIILKISAEEFKRKMTKEFTSGEWKISEKIRFGLGEIQQGFCSYMFIILLPPPPPPPTPPPPPQL
jgi:hypothetical protein